MNYMEVCPNACGCVVIFWRENVHTIGRESTKYELRWFINVSISNVLNQVSLLMGIDEHIIKLWNTIKFFFRFVISCFFF